MSKSLHLNKLPSVIGHHMRMRDMSQRSGSQEVVRRIAIAQLKMKMLAFFALIETFVIEFFFDKD